MHFERVNRIHAGRILNRIKRRLTGIMPMPNRKRKRKKEKEKKKKHLLDFCLEIREIEAEIEPYESGTRACTATLSSPERIQVRKRYTTPLLPVSLLLCLANYHSDGKTWLWKRQFRNSYRRGEYWGQFSKRWENPSGWLSVWSKLFQTDGPA